MSNVPNGRSPQPAPGMLPPSSSPADAMLSRIEGMLARLVQHAGGIPTPVAVGEQQPSAGLHTVQQNAYGRAQKVSGRDAVKFSEIGRVQVAQPIAWNVALDVRDFALGPSESTVGLKPLAKIQWGAGSTAIEAVVDATYHADLPVDGNMVRVAVSIQNDDGDGPTDPETGATFRLSIAPGVLGVPQRNSRYVQTVGGSQFIKGSQRLFGVRGFDVSGSSGKTLMGIDSAIAAPADGALPLISIPIPAFPLMFNEPYLNSVPFTLGIAWWISTTKDVLTKDAGADKVRIETEIERY